MPKHVPAKSTPKTSFRFLLLPMRNWIRSQTAKLGEWVQLHWFRLLVLSLLTFIILRKNVHFQLNLDNATLPTQISHWMKPDLRSTAFYPQEGSQQLPAHASKKRQQKAYVKRFAAVAQKEMAQFGIPASIKLAQGLLETNAGESPLALKNNNHFGLKCFSRTCKKDHCTNFSDDSHKDFFRRFASAWESYRAHSLLLAESDRYQSLFELPKTDYEAWAKGLKKAGYATDRQYDRKLVRLIEDLQLYTYDV